MNRICRIWVDLIDIKFRTEISIEKQKLTSIKTCVSPKIVSIDFFFIKIDLHRLYLVVFLNLDWLTDLSDVALPIFCSRQI